MDADLPSTAIRVPTPTPAIERRPRNSTEIDAVPSTRISSTVGRVVQRRDPDRADAAGDLHPLAPGGVGDRHAARHERRSRSARRRRWPGAGCSTLAALAGGAGAARDDGRQRDPLRRRAQSRWNGTEVTLAWGSRETCSRIASAGLVVQHAVPDAPVLPVGEEHRHLGLAVGQLADDALHRGADEPAVGAVDDLERHALQARCAPTPRPARRRAPRRRRSARRAARRA